MALVDAGRDRYPQLLASFRPPFAMTRRAGVLDDPALALAARAGADVDHLAEHRLADRADLTATLALRTGRGLRAVLRPGPGAGRAPVEDRELDLGLEAVDRLLERQTEVVAQVAADRRASVAGPRPGAGAAEERIEDVPEAREAGPEPASLTGATEARLAERVVGLAALRVRQDLVGLVDLLEPGVGRRVLAHVRVPLLGELAERALDLGLRRPTGDAEHLVVVALRHHRPGSLREVRGQDHRRCTRRKSTSG